MARRLRSTASLREDYLNQVQRDSLSRHPRRAATPLAGVPNGTGGILAGGDARIPGAASDACPVRKFAEAAQCRREEPNR